MVLVKLLMLGFFGGFVAGAFGLGGGVVFNPILTWVEYVNRLLGALTGVFIFITVILAFRAFGWGWISGLSVVGFLLTGFQGWLGAKVVSTALLPWVITAHNLMAQIIVYVLIAAYLLSARERQLAAPSKQERNLALLAWAFGIFQFYLGLGVRQWTDTLEQAGAAKDAIIADFLRAGHTPLFLIHRSFSWILAGLLLWQAWRYIKARQEAYDEGIALQQAAIGCVLGNIGVGVMLQYTYLSPAAQPLHLLLGSVLLGTLFALAMLGFIKRPTFAA
jgi:cytochrome c oxidase assembly protein subunit 15